jgi:DNA invertase Pin-like site-specific DNA recombinase
MSLQQMLRRILTEYPDAVKTPLEANPLARFLRGTAEVLHLYAALAEKERRLISQRTRDALAAKKAQGRQLGNPKLVAAAAKRDKMLRPILQKLAGQSLRAIAAELDRRGIKSWSGKPWNAVSVRNAMVRLGFQTTRGVS